jgi:hypothetical protein
MATYYQIALCLSDERELQLRSLPFYSEIASLFRDAKVFVDEEGNTLRFSSETEWTRKNPSVKNLMDFIENLKEGVNFLRVPAHPDYDGSDFVDYEIIRKHRSSFMPHPVIQISYLADAHDQERGQALKERDNHTFPEAPFSSLPSYCGAAREEGKINIHLALSYYGERIIHEKIGVADDVKIITNLMRKSEYQHDRGATLRKWSFNVNKEIPGLDPLWWIVQGISEPEVDMVISGKNFRHYGNFIYNPFRQN